MPSTASSVANAVWSRAASRSSASPSNWLPHCECQRAALMRAAFAAAYTACHLFLRILLIGPDHERMDLVPVAEIAGVHGVPAVLRFLDQLAPLRRLVQVEVGQRCRH